MLRVSLPFRSSAASSSAAPSISQLAAAATTAAHRGGRRLFSPSSVITDPPTLVVPAPRSADDNSAAAFAAGAGRSFEAHERSCGMLFTLESIKHVSPASASSSQKQKQNQVAPSAIPRRLGALVKATSADWQINEIPADDVAGEPVFLTNTPKGRWVKVAGKVVKKVETSAGTPFSDPNKDFREMAVTFGSYVHRVGKVPVDRDVLDFSLYRENTPWRAVLRRMKKRLLLKKSGEENSRIVVSSPKEAYGCVTQRGRIRGVSAEELPHASRHFNINPILFNPLGFVSTLSPPPPVAANRWRVLLRCVDGTPDEIESALHRVATQGAPNYFPLQCFGAAGGGTAVDLAVAVDGRRFFDACRIWLQNEAERDPLLMPYYRRYLAVDGSAVGGVLKTAAVELKDQRAQPYLVDFFEKLATAHSSSSSSSSISEDFCEELWSTTVAPARAAVDSEALEAAPAFFLWNLAASQRLYQFGARAAAGDFVESSVSSTSSAASRRSRRREIIQIDGEGVNSSSSNFTLDDVLVPLPSSQLLAKQDGSWYTDFYRGAMKRFSIPESALDQQNQQEQAQQQQQRFRKLVLKPLSAAGMQYKIVRDPNSLSLLRTDLFVRQERRLPQTMSLEERFREPTLFNVSDAFRERMQPALHEFPPPSSSSGEGRSVSSSSASSARCSVAVECDLPHGSHIVPLLREAFVLRHLHSNDMLDFGSL